MKVVILSNTVGVIYKFKYELLKKLVEEGHEVFLMAQNENEDIYLERLKKLGIEYKEIKISRRGKNIFEELKLFITYYKILKKYKPERILTYTIKPNIYGSLVSQLLKIPHIVTITGVGTSFQKKNMTRLILILLTKLSLRKARKVFFENVENLKLYINLNLIKKNQEMLVNGSGVNLERFYPMPKTIKKSCPVILFIGRIMREKGIEEYLEAAKKIKKSGFKVEFQILGSWEEEIWKEKVKEYEKKGWVKYLGVSDDVREEIRNCDIVVNPSYHEGMSNVLLEAGAMGKLLLASNIPGGKEIIVDKSLLFEKINIEDMIEKVKIILKMSKINQQKIVEEQIEYIKNKFSRDLVIKQCMEVIEDEDKKKS